MFFPAIVLPAMFAVSLATWLSPPVEQPDFTMQCTADRHCDVQPVCNGTLAKQTAAIATWSREKLKARFCSICDEPVEEMPNTIRWERQCITLRGVEEGEAYCPTCFDTVRAWVNGFNNWCRDESRSRFSPSRPPPGPGGGSGQATKRETNSDEVREARRVQACKAVSGSDKRALMDFAIMVQFGMGGVRDEVAARLLYQKVNTRQSSWYLGVMVEHGEGGPVDLPAARALYKRSSEGGQIDARYEYARMLRAGTGGPPDPVEARRLLVQVGEYCHGNGAAELAEMAEKGEGGPVDIPLAAKQYVRAAICSNPYFRKPVILSSPERISVPVRVEIQRMQSKKKTYQGPRDGSLEGWAKALSEGNIYDFVEE